MLSIEQKAAAWSKTPEKMSFEEREYTENPGLYESLNPRLGFDLEKLGAMQHQSAWKDVMAKAKNIIDRGGVNVFTKEPKDKTRPAGIVLVSGAVIGDSAVYNNVYFEMPNPVASTVYTWNCGCQWAKFRRPGLPNLNTNDPWPRLWQKYQGRVCSHILALYWSTAQNNYTVKMNFNEVDWGVLRANAATLTQMGVLSPELAEQIADDQSPVDPSLIADEEKIDPRAVGDWKRAEEMGLSLPFGYDPSMYRTGPMEEEGKEPFAIKVPKTINELLDQVKYTPFRIERRPRGPLDTGETETLKQEIRDLEELISVIEGAKGNPVFVAVDNAGNPIPSDDIKNRANEIVSVRLPQKGDVNYIVPIRKSLQVLRKADFDDAEFLVLARGLFNLITGASAPKEGESWPWDALPPKQQKEYIKRWKDQNSVFDNLFSKSLKDIRKKREQISILYMRRVLNLNFRPGDDQMWINREIKERAFWKNYDAQNGTSYLQDFEDDLKENIINAINNSWSKRIEADPGQEEQEKFRVFEEGYPEEAIEEPPAEEEPKMSSFTVLASDFPINDITIYLQNEIGNNRKPPAYVRREMWGEQRGGLHPHPDAMPTHTRADGNFVYSPDDLGYHPEFGEMGYNEEERGTYGSIPVGERVDIISVHPKDRMVLVEYNLDNPSPNHQHIHLWVPIKDVDLV